MGGSSFLSSPMILGSPAALDLVTLGARSSRCLSARRKVMPEEAEGELTAEGVWNSGTSERAPAAGVEGATPGPIRVLRSKSESRSLGLRPAGIGFRRSTRHGEKARTACTSPIDPHPRPGSAVLPKGRGHRLAPRPSTQRAQTRRAYQPRLAPILPTVPPSAPASHQRVPTGE